ncbi:MAG: hypothetical protein D5R99_06845 [Methanocalculus sp. MSAO_Arc1]|uniref:DUF7714 family protein n=1 Tax=Methanocalculus TaxID=71151 RepID=UPI000FEF1770|nr:MULTISPECIES: hypothetical protein [unclassified Methanocalculus]MCP1663044.1 hypothetical protein [Methanocalculus sp. AMF5]RQD79825.1 MAG: hypothetical protein D5R99_06845 [Methanocalculus sp. MSAO_Arc1]
MIFPPECKVVGHAYEKPVGDKVYFLSEYLVRRVPDGFELLRVTPDPEGSGMMRDILHEEVLATAEETVMYSGRVNQHDRAGMVRLALKTGKRCTIFGAMDEHINFVLDPDLSEFETVHVYDIRPPRANLSVTIEILEEQGLLGDLNCVFEHHVRDISMIDADVYPCRAGGFAKTLDMDRMKGGERIAGCLTGQQLYQECYGPDFSLIEICPLSSVSEEPFVARCCRKERSGIGLYNGFFGAVVHWGASPKTVLDAVYLVVEEWRRRNGQDSSRSG